MNLPIEPSSAIAWGIRAGRGGEGHQLFKDSNVIALRWQGTPDLSGLPNDREAFKEVYRRTFPDVPEGNVANGAGQLYRFVHEIAVGDLVVYPSKIDRRVHLGVVDGPYRYVQDSAGFSHQRPVKWLRSVPRTSYSQGALHEIGSAMTLFQVKNYLDEHLTLLSGHVPVIQEAEEDESISLVASEVEETTRDFILKTLAKELKGHPFASFVAQLLATMGYNTRVSPPGPDGGVDVLAHRDELGFEPPIIKVQVKSTESSIGSPEVTALYGNVEASEFGLFVTLGSFTSAARNFAKSKPNLRLIDGLELVDLLLEHYEELDSRYKGRLPLRRVYIPEAVDAD